MDDRTIKLMTMHKALHPWDDVDWLDVSRRNEGWKLTTFEGCVKSVNTGTRRLHSKQQRQTN